MKSEYRYKTDDGAKMNSSLSLIDLFVPHVYHLCMFT